MPTQGENASAWPTDVAEQKLQNCGRANDLYARRVVRPSDRVTDAAVLSGPDASDKRLGDFSEHLPRNTAKLLHHLRGVTREVPA